MPAEMLLLVLSSSLVRRYCSSRSTASFDDLVFSDGWEDRRDRLDEALKRVGVDPRVLETDPRLDGSPGLRAYRSFVLPKSEGAFAIANQPSRARTVAAQIAYFNRETVAEKTEWLVNWDRAVAETSSKWPVDIVLDGIRSGENVGNIIRTCETASARSVSCCGTTPAPPHPTVLKAACKAVVDVRSEPSAFETIKKMQSDSTIVWAIETEMKGKSVSLYDVDLPSKKDLAIVFGNELMGVSPDIIEAADAVVHIPTFGMKNSLNVASATAVVLYEIVRRYTTR